MSVHDFQIEMTKLFFAGMVLSVIGTLIGLYVLYLVVRWGVRDGIKDARRSEPLARHTARGAKADAVPEWAATR